jgi:DNA-binding transcriptional MerR regulator
LSAERKMVTTRVVSQRYGIADRTVSRWTATGVLPEPTRINGRKYWDLDDLDTRDAARMTPPSSERAAR